LTYNKAAMDNSVISDEYKGGIAELARIMAKDCEHEVNKGFIYIHTQLSITPSIQFGCCN
jgi:hypothetical protein